MRRGMINHRWGHNKSHYSLVRYKGSTTINILALTVALLGLV